MGLRNVEVEEGYTLDAIVSRQAGEENLVLEIGRAALQHPDANPFTHDCLLSMALAECFCYLQVGGGGFGCSSHEPKYKIEFHEPHSPFHLDDDQESMVMSDKNGQKISCFLPKEDKTKTSKFVTQ
ncbi:hypothetical protein IFM89_014405 [Coptis chinensis]|uniref:Plastid division protein CDP1-like 1st alpha solenoid domain-containing protein n=1 Tax=Coptis chinensis TaxID=261450 RepID=A0A835LEB7_9MAGN|nr:hypothetical protein IFM89_014405 [Coptis chinensis]